MANQIKVSDFVKLTGTTLKTVIYYHKIGLLQEPQRSIGGYRLYGAKELTRMQLIKHLKSLGMDLKRVKETIGDAQNHKTLREVLQVLRIELQSEKRSLEERIAKIEEMLSEDKQLLDEDSLASPSFKMITEILGADQTEKYAETCPQLFEQQRKVQGILDDFQWGEDHKESFRAIAEFFKEHPQEYKTSLEFGVRLAKLAQLSEDDPEVDMLARESAEFVKKFPILKGILSQESTMEKPVEGLYNDMVAKVISPAQIKHGQLLQHYLSLDNKQSK